MCSSARNTVKKTVTHLCGFADKVIAPHQCADGHLEEAALAVVLCDAAERMHDQQLLKGLQ